MPNFGHRWVSSFDVAAAEAQERSDANGAPVAIWDRDGCYTISETPADMIEPNPEDSGWRECALVEPTGWDT
jgi:hypothetical protein